MNHRPNINVTPLIDVLLVLLIIFMVAAPPKPTNFKAKIPSEPKTDRATNTHPDALVVALDADLSLRLNREAGLGSVADTERLTARLGEVFRARAAHGAWRRGAEFDQNLTQAERIEKTVFIKAPRSTDYGSVVKVVDAVKLAGANPISLQIDDLN